MDIILLDLEEVIILTEEINQEVADLIIIIIIEIEMIILEIIISEITATIKIENLEKFIN